MGRLNRELTEQMLKYNYRAVLRNESTTEQEPADFDEQWSNIWRKRIMTTSARTSTGETVTFDEFLAEDNFATNVEPMKLQAVTVLVSPIVLLAQVVVIIFLDRFLSNHVDLVTVIQVGLFSSLIISLLLFDFHAHQNAEVPVVNTLSAFPKEVVKPFADRIKSFGEEPFRPVKVTITKLYLSLVRDYFGVSTFWAALLNTCTFLICMGLSLSIGFILQPTNMSRVLPWYKSMAIGLSFLPFGMLAGYYLAFLVVQYARVLIAPIIVGLLAAVLPYALGYLFTGQIDVAKVQNSVLAAGTAMFSLGHHDNGASKG